MSRHTVVEGPALALQRLRMRDTVVQALPSTSHLRALLTLPSALAEPLPHGHAQEVGELLGFPSRTAGERARQMWAGKRTYHPKS